MQKGNKRSSSRSHQSVCVLSVVAVQFKERASALCAVSQSNKNIWGRPIYSLIYKLMFQNYSGTFFAVISMIVVPEIVQLGFDQSCAVQIMTVAGTGVLVLIARYFKGGVNIAGVRKP